MSERNLTKFLIMAVLVVGFANAVVAEEAAILAPSDALAAMVTDFKQSSNDNKPNPLGYVIWISSILQQNNSLYYEGMSTLQRVLFLNIPPATTGDPNVHVLRVRHQANKATSHAYDFLTSWPQGITAAAEIGGPDVLVTINQCGPNIGPPSNLGDICNALHSGGNTFTADIDDAMDTLLGDNVADAVAEYEADLGSNRTIKIYGNAPITWAYCDFVGYTGSTDKYADYDLTWTSASDQICIELAGHLACGLDAPGQFGVGYGAGVGSSNINGGPYHFKLETLDGASLGSQDNQIKGADIQLPPPKCAATPATAEICAFGSATFSDSAYGGTPPYVFCWTKGTPGTTSCLDTDSVFTISNAAAADSGTYYVVVTDSNGKMDTCSVHLTVDPPLSCSVSPDSAFRCAYDGGVDFCVIPSGGTAPYTYSWSTGDTDSCITDITAAGTYTVMVTDAMSCTTSCHAHLAVNPALSCSVSPDSAFRCAYGPGVQFCVNPVGGTPPYTYSWSNGDTDSCITDITAAGTYTVVVTDAKSCTTSCHAHLAVNPALSCSVEPDSAARCPDDPGVDFCVMPVGGTPPYTYSWSTGSTDSCITDITAAGTYTVMVTDAKSCTTSCHAHLTVNDKPVCVLTCPDPLPDCGSTGNTISGGAGFAYYAWTLSGPGWIPTGGAATQTLTYTAGDVGSTGHFTLIVTDDNGCSDTCSVDCGCTGETVCTFTQGGWGSDCPVKQQPRMGSTQPGCIRDHYFSTVFPSGVTIGGSPFHATWTTPAAVNAFLPATTTPGVLTANLTNPTSTPAGVFAGQLLALKLNVGFSCAGIFYQLGMQPSIVCVGDIELPDTCAGKFGDMTVDELIDLADEVIAGNVSALVPFGASISDLSDALGCINQLFDGCGNGSGMMVSAATMTDAPAPAMDALESMALPTEFVVTGVVPNPLMETVAISYGLPKDGAVNIEIYNIQGQKVVTLVSDMQSAGYRSTTWDGKDNKGASTAPGVYFLRAQFEDRPEIMVKMVKLH